VFWQTRVTRPGTGPHIFVSVISAGITKVSSPRVGGWVGVEECPRPLKSWVKPQPSQSVPFGRATEAESQALQPRLKVNLIPVLMVSPMANI
jgi:hypothetical protein